MQCVHNCLIGCLAVSYSRMANATLPSALPRFTSEFGMGSGGSTALWPPGKKLQSRKADVNNDLALMARRYH